MKTIIFKSPDNLALETSSNISNEKALFQRQIKVAKTPIRFYDDDEIIKKVPPKIKRVLKPMPEH